MAEYERENNPIIEFLEEFGDLEYEPVQKVYDSYTLWSSQAGHRNTLSRKKIFKAGVGSNGVVQSKYPR